MNLVLNLIVVSASVLGSGMALPQAFRLAKTRNVEGVSATWIGVSMAINTWWLAYALAASLWALVPVSLISLAVYVAMAALYLHTVGRVAVPGFALGMFGLGMMPMPALVFGGWAVAGLAIGLGYGIQLAPAVIAAYRSRELDGVSSGTWILSFAEGLLWLVYGVGIADVALLVGGMAGVVMAGAILARLVAVGSVSEVIRVGAVTRVKVARN